MVLMQRTQDDHQLTPGQWLKAARKAARLTQDAVGEVVGRRGATVSQWENGRILSIREEHVPKLARLLGKGVVETRRGLGLYVPDDAVDDIPQPPPSVLEAIYADPDLREDFREHIANQYRILREATLVTRPQPESPDHTRARDDLRRARTVEGSSPDCDNTHGA